MWEKEDTINQVVGKLESFDYVFVVFIGDVMMICDTSKVREDAFKNLALDLKERFDRIRITPKG